MSFMTFDQLQSSVGNIALQEHEHERKLTRLYLPHQANYPSPFDCFVACFALTSINKPTKKNLQAQTTVSFLHRLTVSLQTITTFRTKRTFHSNNRRPGPIRYIKFSRAPKAKRGNYFPGRGGS